ncbi:MAG: PDZ domain-containing protein [Acidobacteriota bacterium]|nr:PDZ domain-containing protein [Acidobacteriota bacterium]
MRKRNLICSLIFALGILSAPNFVLLAAETSAATPVHFTISLAGAAKHAVDVKIDLGPGSETRDLQLPVWNALYQIRDFSRNVNWIHAKDTKGNDIPVHALDKSRWRVERAGRGATIEYQILANTSGPFGAQLNSQHGFFNLAEILMYPQDARASQMSVHFASLPSDWKIATALTSKSAGEFEAKDYDQLVDSPVELGTFQESDFDEGGGHYRVVVDAAASDYQMKDVVSTLRRIVSAAVTWMNDRPFETYLFIYHFPRAPAGGGMEHAYSTAIDISAKRLADNPRALSDVSAHEFFHLWNVKRIKPQSLEPVDYSKENYSRALWFSEGVTSTAALYFRARAGLMEEAACLKSIAGQIGELQQRPAHKDQSVEESSLDAWLEKYDDYDRPERSISYYNKGFLVGVLLDLRIREASRDTASLREVFQWMNEHYAKQDRSFPDSEGVRAAAETVSHADLKAFFEKYVSGTEEIPWNGFFKGVGLRLVIRTRTVADPGFVVAQRFNVSPAVISVNTDSGAAVAGLEAGDSVVEINGHLPDANFAAQLSSLKPGETIRLTVRRGSDKRNVQWVLGSREETAYELSDIDGITPQDRVRRTAWLKGESEQRGDTLP